MRGRVKRLVPERSFGFVRGDDGREYFFHKSGMLGSFESLQEGQAVTFEEEPSLKGPRARRVEAEERG